MSRRAFSLTPSWRKRSYAERESATVASAKRSFLMASPSAGTLHTVWTLGTRRIAPAKRPAAELFGLGAKKKCQRSAEAPNSRWRKTPKFSLTLGAKPPADAGPYTASMRPRSIGLAWPGRPIKTGEWRCRFPAMSRTRFLLLSFQGGATGLDTKRTSVMNQGVTPRWASLQVIDLRIARR
jgi:hypothetical protein